MCDNLTDMLGYVSRFQFNFEYIYRYLHLHVNQSLAF